MENSCPNATPERKATPKREHNYEKRLEKREMKIEILKKVKEENIGMLRQMEAKLEALQTKLDIEKQDSQRHRDRFEGQAIAERQKAQHVADQIIEEANSRKAFPQDKIDLVHNSFASIHNNISSIKNDFEASFKSFMSEFAQMRLKAKVVAQKIYETSLPLPDEVFREKNACIRRKIVMCCNEMAYTMHMLEDNSKPLVILPDGTFEILEEEDKIEVEESPEIIVHEPKVLRISNYFAEWLLKNASILEA